MKKWRLYYIKNKDKVAKYHKIHNLKNKVKIEARRKKYIKDNRDWYLFLMRTRCNRLLFGGNKYKVLERDKNKCKKCGLTNKEHLGLYGASIHVHHKDMNRKNNSMDNLITVCVSCHAKEHCKILDNKWGINA